MLRLIQPTRKYLAEYKEALLELKKESLNPHLVQYEIDHLETVITEARTARTNKSRPRSEFWLMDGAHYIGTIQIRHKPSGKNPQVQSHVYYEIRPRERQKGYGEQILKLGIRKARLLGIKKLLLACNEGNTASRKVIEKNNGVLTRKVKTPQGIQFLYTIYL